MSGASAARKPTCAHQSLPRFELPYELLRDLYGFASGPEAAVAVTTQGGDVVGVFITPEAFQLLRAVSDIVSDKKQLAALLSPAPPQNSSKSRELSYEEFVSALS